MSFNVSILFKMDTRVAEQIAQLSIDICKGGMLIKIGNSFY